MNLNYRSQKLFAWSGVAFIVLFGIGFAVAGFIPPAPSPGDSAHDAAQLFRDRAVPIRVGLIIMMYASALLTTWGIPITIQMRRIEGRDGPLSWAQVLFSALFTLEFIIPIMVLQAATFRPERSDESIQLMSDIAWLAFMGVDSTILLQGVVLGVVILRDKRAQPIFPRWSGYFSIWAMLVLQPGATISFFKHGPLTWNGLLVWWIPIFSYAPWMLIFSYLTMRAIKRQEQDPSPSDPVDGPDDAISTATLTAEVADLRAELDRLSGTAPHPVGADGSAPRAPAES